MSKKNGTDMKTTSAPYGGTVFRVCCAVLSLVLILISAASCGKQNKDGQTTAAAQTSVSATAAEQTAATLPVTTTEAVTQTLAPSTTVEQTTTAAPSTTAAPVTTAAPTSAVPTSKAEIVSFYAAAVNDIKFNGSASYDKVEYQKIHDVNMTGNATVDRMIRDSIGSFAKDENTAPHVAAQKGTASSKDNMLGWGLADDSAVLSASLQQTGGNYKITILMADEDTPDRSAPRHLEAMGSVMYLDEVEGALGSVPQMKEFGDIHIIYTGYAVAAEITPEGRLVSVVHHSNVEIRLGHMKILVISLDDKSISLENFVEFRDFVY